MPSCFRYLKLVLLKMMYESRVKGMTDDGLMQVAVRDRIESEREALVMYR